MSTERDRSDEVVPHALDKELATIRAAIDLVASGGSARVTLSGLHFAEPLLEAVRELADRAGVRIVPVWTAAEHTADLAVERIAP